MPWAGGEVLERAEDRRSFARAAVLTLGLNAVWPPVFFRAHRPALAALESAVLTVSAADLIRRAGRVSPGARAVLVPWGVGPAFARALSTDIARRNPEGLSRR